MTRLLAPLAVALAAIHGCADLGGDPDVPVALEFDSIPFPAVLTGDSMRDSLGVAAPLRGVAYNGRGGVIVGAPLRFFALDTGVTIDLAGYLHATRRDGAVRVVASVSGLQTEARTIQVTRRPDTLFAASDTLTAFAYALPDLVGNVAPELRIAVKSGDSIGVSPSVAGWLVRWRALHAGDTLAPGDTAMVVLQSTTGRRSAVDTTSADGGSARRLRIFANRLVSAIDSFIVVAEVKLHGTPVPGSPIRFVVTVSPAAP